MKTIATLLILFFSIPAIAQLKLPPERKDPADDGIYPEERLEGNIERMIVTSYWLVNDSASKKISPSKISDEKTYYYRKDHNLVSETWRVADQHVQMNVQYAYDDDGRLLRVLHSDSKIYSAQDSIVYDDSRNMITQYKHAYTGFEKRIFFFDDKGLLNKEEVYTKNMDSPSWLYQYEYDDQQRVVKETKTNVGRLTYMPKMNDTTRVPSPGFSRLHRYTGSKTMGLHSIYETDDDSNLLKESYSKDNSGERFTAGDTRGMIRIDVLQKNSNGFVVSREYGSNSYTTFSDSYYDNNNRLLRTKSNLSELELEYEFDAMGNWIVQRLYINKKLVEYRTRSFQYFK
jgi:YD repeat-containing protein